MRTRYTSNDTFVSAWSVGADGIVAESLGGLMTAGALQEDGVIDTTTRAVTITTLPRGVHELTLSAAHARPGQLFTLYCVAGGSAALHPVVLTAGDTAVFGEHGSNSSGAGPRMLFGPEVMAKSAALQGTSLFYTATFMFSPCAPPAPVPVGSHQTYCRPGDGAVWHAMHAARWLAVPTAREEAEAALALRERAVAVAERELAVRERQLALRERERALGENE